MELGSKKIKKIMLYIMVPSLKLFDPDVFIWMLIC
jgi:hypothetical protein